MERTEKSRNFYFGANCLHLLSLKADAPLGVCIYKSAHWNLWPSREYFSYHLILFSFLLMVSATIVLSGGSTLSPRKDNNWGWIEAVKTEKHPEMLLRLPGFGRHCLGDATASVGPTAAVLAECRVLDCTLSLLKEFQIWYSEFESCQIVGAILISCSTSKATTEPS